MSSPDRRAKTPTPTASISIPQGPRFSPPKSPAKDSSPVRKPLHERSHSHANQHSSPTIRLVHQESNDDIYQKYPVPSEPSQILSPPRHALGYGFERPERSDRLERLERPERPGSWVSSDGKVANVVAKFEASQTPSPQPILSRKKATTRHSNNTSLSEEDTLIASSFTPSSLRFSQDSTTPSSPPPEFEEDHVPNVQEEPEPIPEEAPPTRRPTIRAVPPSSSGGESLESRTRALTPKASAASFASTIHAAQPSSSSHVRNPSRLSVQGPLPQDEHASSSSSHPEAGRPDQRQPVLKSQQSTESITFSDISYTSIEPTAAPSLHEARTSTTFASGIRINYPLARAPSINNLRAESHNPPNILSRMQDRSLVHQWSSQLSTIPSGSERDSRSIARGSRSFGARSHSQESYAGSNTRRSLSRRRRQTISSAQSTSDNASSEGPTENSAVPRPLFSPVPHGSKGSLDDNNSEHLDTISPLPSSVPLRMKVSGYLHRSNSVETLSANDSRPGSSHSSVSNFIASTIPAWARVYYQQGGRISGGAPESEYAESIAQEASQGGRSRTPSESNYPPNIYRPRNRPRNRAASTADTVSLADDVQSIDGAIHTVNVRQMYQLREYSTPHLRTDRRGQTRYSAWNAPSLDDDIHVTLLGRQNRQILLFCLGFLCPLAWMVASFLPLPPDPKHMVSPDSSQGDSNQPDLEQHFAQSMGHIDDKAFQKATWWRNLNRVMSGIGTLLIGVIIALAILASRMP